MIINSTFFDGYVPVHIFKKILRSSTGRILVVKNIILDSSFFHLVITNVKFS